MNVRPIRLDFIDGGTKPALWRWALLIVACVITLWRGGEYFDAASTRQALQSRYDKVVYRSVTDRPVRLAAADVRLLAEQVKAVNPIIRNLNLPWNAVFKALQPHKVMKVILLGLDTAGRADRLRISGQAASPQEMVDYVAYLAEKPQLRDVYLLKHEVLRESGYRFEMEAAWKDER